MCEKVNVCVCVCICEKVNVNYRSGSCFSVSVCWSLCVCYGSHWCEFFLTEAGEKGIGEMRKEEKMRRGEGSRIFVLFQLPWQALS